MQTQVQIYDKESGALKHVEQLDTSDPVDCLTAIMCIWRSGGNITENMAVIPTVDKERLFNYLNDEAAFPTDRYTRRVEEIREALGLDLA